MNMQLYYMKVVRSAKNDLCNPRVTFSWGYRDAKSDLKAGRPIRDVSNHDDPYYSAGYTCAQQGYTSDISSEVTWELWIAGLGREDYNFTARSVLESLIRGREYLFLKKTPRADFRESDCNDIVSHYDRNMPAGNSKQFLAKHVVLSEFGLT